MRGSSSSVKKDRSFKKRKRALPVCPGAVHLAAVLAAALFLCGCGAAGSAQTASPESGAPASSSAVDPDGVPSASGDLFAMDTYMTVTCYGEKCEEALEASLKEIERLDALWSVGQSDSEISRINEAKEGDLGAETAAVVGEALDVSEMTGGAFDITVAPLMELWGFTTGEYRVPDETEITAALKAVGSDKLVLEEAGDQVHLTLAPGQAIDLGGIAKGYTSDRLMEIFEDYGLTAGLVSLGGNVQCFGTKPDGTLWRCGIRDPFKSDDASAFLGVVETADKAVITSGGYERFFEDEATGQTYHHILDPSTGYPAESGIVSVTVVSGSGILADALTTAVYVMGLERAKELWEENREGFDMILMTEDKEVYVTAGIADAFTSSYPVKVIE